MASFSYVSGHPTYEIGGGSEPLVILPGLSDAFQPATDSRLNRLALEKYYYRSYVDDYTLYVVSRPRNLPEGATTRDMANGYGDVIEEIGGPVHVEGLSMGGLIAQHLAADHPELVETLVVGVSGARVSGYGKEVLGRWRDMARNGDWFEIYLDSIPVTYGADIRARAYGLLLPTVGRFVVPEPASVDDIVVQSRACIDHDATDRLGEIDAPTLVIGGADDPLFPPDILRETADGIPNARLEILENAAHGAFEQRKRVFDSLVRMFLDGSADRFADRS